MRRICLLFAALLLSLIPLPGTAVTLSDLHLLAVAHDPQFKAAIREHEAGQEEAAIGLAELLPAVSLSYQHMPYNRQDKTWPVMTFYGEKQLTERQRYRSNALNIMLTQPLFDYEAYSKYKASLIRTLAADSRYQQQLADLTVRVSTAWLSLARAADNQPLADAQHRRLEMLLHAAERRLQAGQGSVAEVAESRTRLALMQSAVAEGESEIRLARQVLAGLTGGTALRIDDIRGLSGGDFTPLPLLPATFSEWEQLAVAGNPQICLAQHDVALAAQERETRRAAFLPVAHFFTSWSDTQSGSNNTVDQRYRTAGAGVYVSLPLYNGGRDMAGMRQAAARYQAAGAERDAVVQTLLLSLAQQFQLCRNSPVKLAAADSVVRTAQLRVTAAEKGVTAGQQSRADVVQAEIQVYQAKQEQLNTRYDYLQAWLSLQQHGHRADGEALRQLESLFVPRVPQHPQE